VTRILFITGLTGYGIGGARTEESRLVRGMADRGYEVALTSDVLPADLSGIRHFNIDYPPGHRAGEQIRHAVSEFRPDIAHATGAGMRFLGACDDQLHNMKWVMTTHNVPPAERIFPRFHGSEFVHYTTRNLLALPSIGAWSRFFRSASYSRVICHSKPVAERLIACGAPADRVREIPFGSGLPDGALVADSTDRVFPPNAFPRITTVAGLTHHKGQIDAIRMAGRLARDYPRLSYRLIGTTRDEAYEAYLEQTIRDLGLAGHVTILQAAPDAIKFAALRESDLYLQPSHEEGFCIAFLEAAMLTPRLLGTATGAIAAMAEGDPTARVVPPSNVDALERAARELLQITQIDGVLDHRRRTLAERFSWDRYFDQHVAVYDEVLAGATAGKAAR
jgi:glycosyltransferase involved in cell wall biosynthesis